MQFRRLAALGAERHDHGWLGMITARFGQARSA
jgi:hypothetical protein